jgi:hypothetical protein
MPKSMPAKKNQTAAALARGTCVTASLGASLPSAQTAAALPHTPSATRSVRPIPFDLTLFDTLGRALSAGPGGVREGGLARACGGRLRQESRTKD